MYSQFSIPVITNRIEEHCNGKICWTSHGAATRHGRWAMRNFNNRMRIYKCPECGWWHTTTKPKGYGKRRK
jgi:hypothetical protein